MRKPGTIFAIVSAALLMVAAAAPVSAAAEAGEASGWVKWKGEGGTTKPRTSVFRVVDGTPGTSSWAGDSGWYAFSDKGRGSLMLDVRCVQVNGDWAEFAGVITHATGNYKVGGVFLVSVYDSGKRGKNGDEIGMGGRYANFNDDPVGLRQACANVMDGDQFNRKGKIYGGRSDIRVRDPR